MQSLPFLTGASKRKRNDEQDESDKLAKSYEYDHLDDDVKLRLYRMFKELKLEDDIKEKNKNERGN